MRAHPRGLILATGLALAWAPTLAAAQPADDAVRQEGVRLYEEGVKLFKQGKFAEAAERFQAAYNIDPSPILLYNLGRATEKAGKPAEAITHYRAYLQRFPQAEDRAQVERIIEALESAARTRQGFLTIEGLPTQGVRVFFDSALAPAPAEDGRWTLETGRYQVQVRTDDGHAWRTEVEILPDQTTAPRYAGPPPPPPQDDLGPSPMLIGGWVGVGVGAAVLAAGGVVFAQAHAAGTDAEDARADLRSGELTVIEADARANDYVDARDDVQSLGLTSYILFGVGAAVATTGAVLLVLDAQDQGGAEAALVPTLGGLGVIGRF